MSLPRLLAPAPLSAEHALDGFDSGEPVLDEWLKRRALKNQGIGASRCFVVCAEQVVVGYYCLSAGAISHESAPKAMRRNMPDPLPVLLLGRLAIDRRYHNQGLGRALLRDAMLRSLSIAMDSGVFALLVHAMSEPAKRFYLSRGFVASTVQPMTLIMTLQTARLILTEPD
jgi:GNAT superfamily N-acetyltransferase